MRTNIFLAVSVITITLLAYNLMGKDDFTKQTQAMIPKVAIDSDLEVQEKLDKLTGILQNYQQISQEQFRLAKIEQDQLKNMLAKLEAKLATIESGVTEQTINDAKLDSTEQDSDIALSSNDEVNPQSTTISEVDLGHWIDESLDAGHWDWNLTTQAKEQAVNSLEELPGITLENMQCGDRFCRATLAHESGKQPEIGNLIGKPPFVNDGFTINEPDGRVSIYFAGNGISLNDLRSDAQAAAQ
ncbi:MAG: hypothetical protein ACN4GM_08275 [Gammaproteobacteria bacterium]